MAATILLIFLGVQRALSELRKTPDLKTKKTFCNAEK